ncbi:putative Origin of replication binding protein [Paratrimastix pyriformis]|uniref:Origin of replication binding protein n=1 Tax=Paratrimastix pyriformis TaxID=342808 RepID=A0ABQ8U6P0_9EUKA|nr:putative Origin of replication binding protein [Paratrimastix pyriformis]
MRFRVPNANSCYGVTLGICGNHPFCGGYNPGGVGSEVRFGLPQPPRKKSDTPLSDLLWKLGGKDQKVASLVRRHPELAREDMCHIIRVTQRGSMTVTQAWEPIDEEHTPANIDYVEVLHSAYTGNIARYFPVWRKLVPRSKTVISVGGCEIELGELTFAIEKMGSKGMDYANKSADEVRAFLLHKRDVQTVHERIGIPVHKAYFDIERCAVEGKPLERIPIERITREIELLLGHCVTVYTACGPKKESYHVICKVLVPREINSIIARHLKFKRGYSCIDAGVYSKNHLFRCFTQDKITRVEGSAPFMARRVVRLASDPECLEVTDEQVLDSLVTYTEGVPKLDLQALDFSQELIALPAPEIVAGDLPAAAIAYLDKNLGKDAWSTEATRSANALRIAHDGPYHCEICEADHDHDNPFVVFKDTACNLYCSRDERDPRVPKEFKLAEKMSPHKRLHAFYDRCDPPTLDHRADEFLQCDITEKLTCIKARMGSGKTQNLSRILTQVDPQCTVVMISCRRTLAFDFMKRYNTPGSKPFESYMDITGAISVHQHQRLIVQVDSLGRVVVGDLGSTLGGALTIKYLVLDEVESLLNQLQSTNDTRIVQHLRELMIHSQHIVAMDGLLQQSTNLIEFNKQMPEYRAKCINAGLNRRRPAGVTYSTSHK